MHFFDPARPQVCNKPAYVDPQGNPIAALQGPYLAPGPAGWTMTWWLICEANSASHFDLHVTDGYLESCLQEFLCDPEEFFKQYLNYTGPKRKETRAWRKPTLAELGIKSFTV